MPAVVPTITAYDPHEYREQMARIADFAKRVHIDLADGVFAPTKTVNPVQVYWPEGLVADLHLMLQNPAAHLETAISLKPDLVIIHAEAQGDLMGVLRQLRAVNIKSGVALLKDSQPKDHHDLIADADHILIFSGDLGHFGGTADPGLLKKVRGIRAINPTAEIGWDGGINTGNIAELIIGGIEVLNVGGAIHKAPDPKDAYATLVSSIPKQAGGD